LPLKMSLHAPASAAVGTVAVFELEITNHSFAPLGQIKLQALLDEGLSHPEGQTLLADVGALAPGITRNFKMPVTALRPGRQMIEVRLVTPSGQESVTSAAVQVVEAALKVKQPTSTRLLAEREGELTIELTNHQAETLRNVVVVNRLPEGVDFAGASDRGLFREDSHSVHWLVDALPGGQTKALTLKVQARKPGQYVNEVAAKADQIPEDRTRGTLDVEGLSTLAVKLSGRDVAVAVGRETSYEVRVQNQGGAAASIVRIVVEMPEGMAASQVRGPVAHRREGRLLVFDPVARIQPGKQVIFQVGAVAQQAGQRRVRVQVSSDQVRQPLVREERITAYRE
jgi:hypothetical protein